MKSFQRIGLRLALALTTTLLGCGTTHHVHHGHTAQFLPETIDSGSPAVCRVVLAQDDPFVASKVTHAGAAPPIGGGSGLVGLGVDVLFSAAYHAADVEAHEVANNDRKDKAAQMSALLAGHGLGASFRTDLQASISNVLSSSSWLHSLRQEMTSQARRVTVTEVNQHPVVQIRFIYHLSYDASALVMQAHLLYFHQGQTNAAYARYYTYFSEPVGSERDAAAVAKWVSSDHELLHRRMNEGMSEVIALLDRDFLNPDPTRPTTPPVTLACYDPLAPGRVQWEGHILREGHPRILFQEKTGNLFSVVPDPIQQRLQ